MISRTAIEAIEQQLERKAFEDALTLLRLYPKDELVMELERKIFELGRGLACMPQRGPQERLMTTSAQLVIYGGGAGGGKTHGTLMYPTRHVEDGHYRAVFFRKSNTETRMTGGLWDEACGLWAPLFNAKMGNQLLEAVFPSGAKIKFMQMHQEGRGKAEAFKGMAAPTIIFDEATAFEEDSIFYIGTRNRSAHDFARQILLTVNPDRDWWGFKFVRPWVDRDFPVKPDADGMLSMIRLDGGGSLPPGVRLDDVLHRDENIVWTRRGVRGSQTVEYIHATLSDNLFIGDDYRARIQAADRISRIRLEGGPQSWFIRATAGEMFDKDWWQVIRESEIPPVRKWVNSWDFAAKKKSKGRGKKPDFTASGLVGITAEPNPRIVIRRVTEGRYTPAEVEALVKAAWESDNTLVGADHDVLFQLAGGEAGHHVDHAYRTHVIPNARLVSMSLTGDKVERAKPTSAMAEQGRVLLVEGDWNQSFIDQAHNFPEVTFDDQVDAVTAGVLHLLKVGQASQRIVRRPTQANNVDRW